MRMLKLPDERIKILVQGIAKAKVTNYIQSDPYYSVRIDKMPDTKITTTTLESEAVMRTVKEQIERIVSLGKVLIPDVMVVIENLEEPGRLADMVASNLGLKVDVTQSVLELPDPIQRLRRVSDILGKEIEVLSMQQKIQAQAKGEMDKTQRDPKRTGRARRAGGRSDGVPETDHRCEDAGKGLERSGEAAEAVGENASGYRRVRHRPHLSRMDGRVTLVETIQR